MLTRRRSVWLIADIVLAVIIAGPVLAPLFAASGLPPLTLVAHRLIYPLGLLICPEDFMLPGWHGDVLAVCSRCYAAIIGLSAVRVAVSGRTPLPALLARFGQRERTLFVLATVALWQFDVWGMNRRLWLHDHPYEIATGLLLGLAVGLAAYRLIARLSNRTLPWERSASPLPRLPHRL